MTDKEKEQIKEFLLSEQSGKFWVTAGDVHGAYPEIVQEVTKEFFDMVCARLKDHWKGEPSVLLDESYPDKVWGHRWQRRVSLWSSKWCPYIGKNGEVIRCTHIEMQSDAQTNEWWIGVSAPPLNSLGSSEDKLRRKSLNSIEYPNAGWGDDKGWWPWRESVFERAPVWDSLVAEMNKEVEAHREGRTDDKMPLSDHIIARFEEIFDRVKDDIEKIDAKAL